MSSGSSLGSDDSLGEKSQDEQIKDMLRSGGLDPSHWFKVFKEELDVNIPEELESIGEESYEELVKHIRKPREVKALQKFLHIETDEQIKPKDSDEGISEKLRSVGLDPSYWLAIVKDELEVRIPEELDRIGKESYQDLVQHVRKEREKKSLRELLGMPEYEECSFQTEREKKRKELKKNQEKAEAVLQQSKEHEKEGKDICAELFMLCTFIYTFFSILRPCLMCKKKCNSKLTAQLALLCRVS